MNYSKYNNKCYLDLSEEGIVFLYQIVVNSETIGLHCLDVSINKIQKYDDFDFKKESELDYFIPESTPNFCEAKEISKETFDKLVTEIEQLYIEQQAFKNKLNLFIDGLGKEI